MKFFVMSLMALGATAAPTLTQVHHTIGQHANTQLGHKPTVFSSFEKVVAAPVTTYQNVVAAPVTTYNKVVAAPLTTYNKVVAAPLTTYNKVVAAPVAQTFAYAQPTTFNKVIAAPVTQTVAYAQPTYVQPSVQTVQVAPAVQTYQSSQITDLPVVQSDRTIQYLDTPHVERPAEVQTFRVGPTANQIHIHFDTESSRLSTSQSHTPAAPAEPKHQEAEDQPSYLNTDIKKNVIQTVRETVVPQREIHQHVAPLTETVHTVASRANTQRLHETYVAPQVHHVAQKVHHVAQQVVPQVQHVQQLHHVPQTFKTVETQAIQALPVQTVQAVQAVPVQTVQAYKPIKTIRAVETFAKPIVNQIQGYLQPSSLVQDFIEPEKTIQVQAVQPVTYVSKPIDHVSTHVVKVKEVHTEKEY